MKRNIETDWAEGLRVICATVGERGEPTRQTSSFITNRRHQSQSTEKIVLNLVLTEDTNPECRA
jgi:hypothetical protein